MRANLALGLAQGIFLPHPRPNRALAGASSARTSTDAEPALAANAMSASAMWAANAATVSPAPDTADGRCHLTVANLRTMPHRSHEWPATLAQLRLAFARATRSRFTVRCRRRSATKARPTTCGSRAAHGEPGVEIFVYGVSGGAFPARQHVEASKAIARLHRLDPERTIFAAAIGGGDRGRRLPQRRRRGRQRARAVRARAGLRRQGSAGRRVRAAGARLRICRGGRGGRAAGGRDSILSVQRPAGHSARRRDDADRRRPRRARRRRCGAGSSATSPATARSAGSRWSTCASRWPTAAARPACGCGSSPIPATVDPRFLVDEAKLDRIADVVRRHWPEQIHHGELQQPALIARHRARPRRVARSARPFRARLTPIPKWHECPSLTATLTLSLRS